MASATQQQQQPPSSRTPSHDQSNASSEHDPWDSDVGDRMFNIYIWDYCNKRGYKKTCLDLQEEAKLGTEFHPPINARQGLLYEWWSVFWVLFGAKNSGSGTEEALVYVQHQQHQILRNQGLHPQSLGLQLGRFPNGVIPPQGGPPPTLANGQPGGIGRGMPPNAGIGPSGVQQQAPMQSLHGPQMMNGIGPGHGAPPAQQPMGQQPPQPGQGANNLPPQNPPGQQHLPHNQQQPQPPSMQQQQHGPTPLGFPGPMPGPGAQQGQTPNQPNGIPGGPHHPAGMNLGPRGSMPGMVLGGAGRGAGGIPPGFHQSPQMAHAHPNVPPSIPGQQPQPGGSSAPGYPGMPGSGMRPGAGPMFPPQPPNGAGGVTTPGAMNAPGTPAASTPGPAGGAGQQFGIPGGSRAATPAAGAGGVGGSALTQRSPSLAAAGAKYNAAPVAQRSRAGKRNSVSPGDEQPIADAQGNKVEGSPPDRKKPRHSPNSESSAPQPGPSGTSGGPNANASGATAPQQPPQVPVGGLAPGMRAGAAPGFVPPPYNVVAPSIQAGMHPHYNPQFKPGAPMSSPMVSQQQNKQGSTMLPPPSPLTANNMKTGVPSGPPQHIKPESGMKAEGSPRGQPQHNAPSSSQASNSTTGTGPAPATPAPSAPSPSHTAPASRPGTASSNHGMTSGAPTPAQQLPPPPSSAPPASTPVGGATGNATSVASAMSSDFDMSFTNLGGISGMEDFNALFHDDFERDFGAWFSGSGAGTDDPMGALR